jgi:NADH:ubiquinone oxidoreductase subunit 6 (subunit J)
VVNVSNPRERFSVRDRNVANIIVAAALLALMIAVFLAVDAWYDGMLEGTIPMFSIPIEDISALIFEEWGALVIILGLVLFSAMIGGVFIAQEEDEE